MEHTASPAIQPVRTCYALKAELILLREWTQGPQKDPLTVTLRARDMTTPCVVFTVTAGSETPTMHFIGSWQEASNMDDEPVQGLLIIGGPHWMATDPGQGRDAYVHNIDVLVANGMTHMPLASSS